MDISIEEACEDFLILLFMKVNVVGRHWRSIILITINYKDLWVHVEWEDFIVYTKQEIFCERVYFDGELWLKGNATKADFILLYTYNLSKHMTHILFYGCNFSCFFLHH